MAGYRKTKARIRQMLLSDDWQEKIEEFREMADSSVVGPLFSLLLDPDEDVRWRAITILGITVAAMAEKDMESARIVMRRFMWHMNEESGNVGWGIPESMAETMVHHSGLADEFHKKLASYVQCPECLGDDNYMDHPPLRQAVYWGLGRLAEVRPALVRHAQADLEKAVLTEESAVSRALACWALGLVGDRRALPVLEGQADAADPVEIFRHGELERTTLGAVAREGIEALQDAGDTVS